MSTGPAGSCVAVAAGGVSAAGAGAGCAVVPASAGPVVGEVIVRAFDDLVEAKEIVLPNGLHAVKIDVEGAEAEVLHGMGRTMRDMAATLFGEWDSGARIVRIGEARGSPRIPRTVRWVWQIFRERLR